MRRFNTNYGSEAELRPFLPRLCGSPGIERGGPMAAAARDAGQCESLAAPLRSRRAPLGVSCTGGPGASPGVSLAPFWTFRKGPAPQGGHLYGPPAWDGWKGATSFVTASAVTPSPEGKAFGGHSVGRATLPQGEAAQTRWKRSFGRGAHCAPLLLFFVKLD